MKSLPQISLTLVAIFLAAGLSAQSQESYYPISPVDFTRVELTDSFWKNKLEVNRRVTIPIAFQRSEESGRIKNFKVAAGIEEGTFNTNRGYDDSDVFKVMEGAAYSLAQHPDPVLQAYLDTLISWVGKAQEEDGYLYTVKTILGVSDKHYDAQQPKWVGIEGGSHELYNVGHMYEAAVAHYEATGKRTFLDIAIKSADLIDKNFGWGKMEIVPGHQEIEIGLVKLYRATGEERYLKLSKFFLDKRGENAEKTSYNQSHQKVTEQTKAVGHSVRAGYMYTAMADMAALTEDRAYVNAMDKLWHDIVDTKLYIIGGIGAAGGHEGFGDHYELPNLRAYNETCAGIANVFWNYRLFLTHGDAKYMDVLERSMYNNVLSGVSLDGDTFFYPNRLESRGESVRSQWFGTSCCPSNIARYLPSVPGYIYAHGEDDIFVNLFISSKTTLQVRNQNVEISQTSQLPWSGKVSLQVNPEKEQQLDVKIRIPGWADKRPVPSDLYRFTSPPAYKTRITINGKQFTYKVEDGYAVLSRSWKPNDQIEVDFPYEVRRIKANDAIPADRGRVALQAGPLVYCAEGFDNAEGNTNHIMIDPGQSFRLDYEKDLLGGVMTINGTAELVREGTDKKLSTTSYPFKAIPYYSWANRGGSEMLVWIPEDIKSAAPIPTPTIASRSKVETTKKERVFGLNSVNDQYKPSAETSAEATNFNWWPVSEGVESITYTFENAEKISESTVYWFKSNDGGVIYPKSWRLLYKSGEKWRPVKAKYVINPDGEPSTVTFKELTTDALKLEIVLDKKPAGLYEWEVK